MGNVRKSYCYTLICTLIYRILDRIIVIFIASYRIFKMLTNDKLSKRIVMTPLHTWNLICVTVLEGILLLNIIYPIILRCACPNSHIVDVLYIEFRILQHQYMFTFQIFTPWNFHAGGSRTVFIFVSTIVQ